MKLEAQINFTPVTSPIMPWNWPKLHSDSSLDEDSLSLSILSAHFNPQHTTIHLALVHATQLTPSDPLNLDLQHHASRSLPADLTTSLQTLDHGRPTHLSTLSDLDAQIGQFAASSIFSFARDSDFSIDEDVELIAFQGASLVDLSWTLGAISTVAARTGTTTIGDFRSSDGNSRSSEVFTALERVVVPPEPIMPPQAHESVALAFSASEAFIGRPVVGAQPGALDDRARIYGQVQLGDNHFEVRGKVVRFWNEWPLDRVESVRAVEIVVSC